MFRIESPAARSSDPQTSHEAAAHVTANGTRAAQQELTATAVRRYPGMTSLELSRHSRIDRYTLARRLSECEDAGIVKRGPARKCDVSGRTAATWHGPDAAIQGGLAL